MKLSGIVKTDFSRTSSTRSLRCKVLKKCPKQVQNSSSNSRNSSIENLNPLLSEKVSPASHFASFIKPKPSAHPLKVSNSSRLINPLNETVEADRSSETLAGLHEASQTINSIVTGLNIKSIEFMKKDFMNCEQVYTAFLALMSEVDEIFEKNLMLQFSQSRAREIFQLYLSRPGQVLLTIKGLPMILPNLRLSKKILSCCQSCLRNLEKSKVLGVAVQIFELCQCILASQKHPLMKTVKQSKSAGRHTGKKRLMTSENMVTEEKTLDISIMDLNTVPNDLDRSASPMQTFDSEESPDFPVKIVNNEKKSTKARLIEQLYLKLNLLNQRPGTDEEFRLATFGQDGLQVGRNNDKENNHRSKSSKEKKPRYMKALDRNERKADKSASVRKENIEGKEEWEEIRNVRIRQNKKTQQETSKKEMIEEIKNKQKEREEMERLTLIKKKEEKNEYRNFLEEDRKEKKRIKEIEALQKKKEIIDDIERNKARPLINMLPILESLSKSNEREEKCSYRGYLLSQNRFLSGIISKNTQTIKQLQQILSLYDSSKSLVLENEFRNKRELSEVLDDSKVYNSKLKLWESFPVSVCKSKYFKISAQLVAEEGLKLIKEDRIGVSVSLFSYDNVPKRITHTMQGRNIFRGNTNSILAFDLVEEKHLVHFKLQIREVSSHFVGGLFYLVLEPDGSLETKGVYIKPLVINNLKVKAKESRGDE